MFFCLQKKDTQTVKLVSSLQTRFKYSKFTKTGTLVKCRFLGIKPQRFGCGWPRSYTGEKNAIGQEKASCLLKAWCLRLTGTFLF